jgi:hypothetical protein
MVDEAVRLMPESLRLALESYRQDVLRGMLEPMTREGDPEHRPPWFGGSVDSRIASDSAALVDSVEQTHEFGEVARRFGTLAHFVADSAFPPGAAGENGAGRYSHFAAFCESRRERIPLVFYGHEDSDLERSDFGAFARRVLKQAKADDADLERAYAAAGDPPRPAAFDDRSVPFAVASIAYSRTITYIVRAWLTAWADAHGDLGGTPYRRP